MEKSVFTPEYAFLLAEIVNARKAAGMSQRDVAKTLEVAHSWIAKVETGERRLDVVELCRLLKACDADVDMVMQRIAKACQTRKRRAGKGRHGEA